MHHLKREQLLPITMEQAWQFFSSPVNLDTISPPGMHFKIKSEVPAEIYDGLFICYSITPVLNIPLTWVTEITHVQKPFYFVDEQRKGPYSIWHHEHHFKEVPGGVLMTDILYYDIGKYFLGWLAGKLFVHQKVKQIFDYRREVLSGLFKPNDGAATL